MLAKWERPVLGVCMREEAEEGSVRGVRFWVVAGLNWNWFELAVRAVKLLDSPERSCSGDWRWKTREVVLTEDATARVVREGGNAWVAEEGESESVERFELGGGTKSWESRGRDLVLEPSLEDAWSEEEGVEGWVTVLRRRVSG